MEWIKLSLSPVKDLVSFLHQKSKTNDVVKKQLYMELRDNLNVFYNGFLNDASYDSIIELISNEAIRMAVKENFKFSKLRAGKIEAAHVKDERNRKYVGWETEKLVDKIDEKIMELRNIRKLNKGSFIKAKNNIPLMMSNLYFRMKLLADFMKAEK